MAKKNYLSPMAKIQNLVVEDVLVTSGNGVAMEDGGAIIAPWETWN